MATRIKIIMVTDDHAHARMLIAGLAQSQYFYLVTEIGARDTLARDLESEIEAARDLYPVIVMLDFEFLQEKCEALVGAISTLKRDMAVEYLVTRPSSDPEFCDRLRQIGVFLFEVSEAVPVPFTVVH